MISLVVWLRNFGVDRTGLSEVGSKSPLSRQNYKGESRGGLQAGWALARELSAR